MAGHSKWKNIQHRKNAQDAKRGKLFMKLAKEIYVAAKEGGSDLATNSSLRNIVDKARNQNMPNDNIERAIKKASGDVDGAHYEEFTYEGYGAGGVAVMVRVLTDNKNRTAAAVRHAFTKNQGNLGENGCVSFMFTRKGIIHIPVEQVTDEEDFMLQAVEAGAEDYEKAEDEYVLYTSPEDFSDALAVVKETVTPTLAEVTFIPETTAHVDGETATKVMALIDQLEDDDDVQAVYTNVDADDDVLQNL
ncbi:YebC/PmpR family DNA-binding transcriptional regulator [Bacillaceae bacterium SIJ1]|uniref:YebC/PmpR family DNA-binding transcriptional regulator n=1 Tax=Litoribacterium kuwaitense TaxID=1398745 RepID=UPI0013E9F006|nr:YebC/PmpR family DNA-binding transcriptional regulator [Litoribacterium kuwaitense]NGP43428.1 YebC/PmpR family DNA-binding transcriptional regulator [Litoribacterium kuwaitense]